MKIRLTKAAVIDILSSEDPGRLEAGHWVGEDAGENPTTCARCAVGALLLGVAREFPDDDPMGAIWYSVERDRGRNRFMRFAPDASWDPPSEEELYVDAQANLADGAPLHALSLVFEGLWARLDPACEGDVSLDERHAIHNKVIGFVLAHFPDTIEIDIDGAVPKDIPGLTVVDG